MSSEQVYAHKAKHDAQAVHAHLRRIVTERCPQFMRDTQDVQQTQYMCKHAHDLAVLRWVCIDNMHVNACECMQRHIISSCECVSRQCMAAAVSVERGSGILADGTACVP